MSFTADAWERNAALYETIRTMPFNEELAAGTLSRPRFEQYITQDAHYLIGFGRALALAATKAPEPDLIVQFCDAAKEAIVVERSLHGSFFADWGIDAAAFEATPVSPGAHHYISFLVGTAFAEPYEVVLASLLPCFWIYGEVGKDIVKRAAPNNPYQAWIDTYASEHFDLAVRTMIELTDKAAASASPKTIDAMHSVYATSTALEFRFWDSAYKLERW